MDRVPFNDLSRGLRLERADLVATLEDVLASGWLVHGPQHAGFEAALASYVHSSFAMGVASGTDALELAIRATMPAGRRTVVTTANCGGYTAVAARRANFRVSYVDVDPTTSCLDVSLLPAALDESVGVVVVTHLYGRAADVTAVRTVCEPLGISVVEDCAQAIGAVAPGGPVGGLADAGAFSFYPTKNLGALGDGGAVTTSRPEVADRVRMLRQYGWGSKYAIELDGGRNSRLDEMQAAVLLSRLAGLEARNRRRRDIVAAYARHTSDRLRVVWSDGPEYVAHLAVVVCDDRPALERHLASAGIQVAVHYPTPDHRQPAYAAEYAGVSLPETERLCAQVLSLPVFPELRDDEAERVSCALESF